jgi:hypothetical protein
MGLFVLMRSREDVPKLVNRERAGQDQHTRA